MVYVFLMIARVMMTEEYLQVLDARNYANGQGQVSAIIEVFEHNNNLNIFMLDYVIDSVRMMFPVELLANGAFYVPFVAFQIFIFGYLIKGMRVLPKLDTNAFIAYCIFVAYYMGSVLFEPDFGSFVRHEAATFPIIVLMVFNSQMRDSVLLNNRVR